MASVEEIREDARERGEHTIALHARAIRENIREASSASMTALLRPPSLQNPLSPIVFPKLNFEDENGPYQVLSQYHDTWYEDEADSYHGLMGFDRGQIGFDLRQMEGVTKTVHTTNQEQMWENTILDLLTDSEGDFMATNCMFKANDLVRRGQEVGDQRLTVPMNELIYQSFLESLEDGTELAANLKAIFVLQIWNFEFDQIATAHYGTDREDMMPMSWRTTVEGEKDIAYEFLGTRVLWGFVRMLCNHHGALGDKPIDKVIIRPTDPTGNRWDAVIKLGRGPANNKKMVKGKEGPKGKESILKAQQPKGSSYRIEKRPYSQRQKTHSNGAYLYPIWWESWRAYGSASSWMGYFPVIFLASASAVIGHPVDSNAGYTDVDAGSHRSPTYTNEQIPRHVSQQMRRRSAQAPAATPAATPTATPATPAPAAAAAPAAPAQPAAQPAAQPPAQQNTTQPAAKAATQPQATNTTAKAQGPTRISKSAFTLYFHWEAKPVAVAGRCVNTFSNLARLVSEAIPQFKPYVDKKALDANIEKRGAELLEQHRAAVKAAAASVDATATQDAAKVAVPDPKKPPKKDEKVPPVVYPHIKGMQGGQPVYNRTKEPVAAFLRHPLAEFYLHHEDLNLELSPKADYHEVQSLAGPFNKESRAFRSAIVNLLIQRGGEYLISWGENKNNDVVRVAKDDVTKTEVGGKKVEFKRSATMPVEELTWQTYVESVGAQNATNLRVVAAMKIVDADFYAVMRENYKDADMVAGEPVIWKPADGKLFNRLVGTEVLANKVQMLTAHHGATGNRDIVSIVTAPGMKWADPWIAAIILGDAKPAATAAPAAAPAAPAAPAASPSATSSSSSSSSSSSAAAAPAAATVQPAAAPTPSTTATQQPAASASTSTAAPAATPAATPAAKASRRRARR
ncbi:uncharacterized protein PpBr36_09633 [Pyricularia pennisetigena]|uniref:uncharacterized protein n=1 Tax=Pyricularia pennisetigena TaxID=1578925 RepID=UPI001150EDE8|nr:uncharacterized protein PpBr36_09633 [Pyricularia pennisetigena]TLS21848.1 hypothetical protein PpBr36_09633 [Pyricularia pennisetigena]